jgi:hypothetical protein
VRVDLLPIAATAAVAAGAAAASASQQQSSRSTLDTPRRSPLMRLLSQSLRASGLQASSAPVEADAAAPAPDREQALLGFARALTQALRDDARPDGEGAPGQRVGWERTPETAQPPAARGDSPVSADGASPAAASAESLQRQHRLLDAFAALQRALGRPESQDNDTLDQELAAFLDALASRLSDGFGDWADVTQPGSLIDLRV